MSALRFFLGDQPAGFVSIDPYLRDEPHLWPLRARWLALIAEDHSFTFRTADQRLSEANERLPFGPET